jgi:ADP-dependent phosphofructokinase/glucokinase
MQLPSKALFAFNANIDYVKAPSEQDLAAIEEFSPPLSAQLSECFAYGVQKEVAIDSRACNFFISKIKFGRKIVGGQAGNAAAQAAALGVSSYLHSNFANTSLASLFSQKENIFFPSEKGFVSADNLNSNTASAHHFVFESIESNTRFIAGYDPFPIHLEDNFCFNITQQLSGLEKAFLGGFHLVKTPDRLRKLITEIRRWKSLNPSMKLFAELGQFQAHGRGHLGIDDRLDDRLADVIAEARERGGIRQIALPNQSQRSEVIADPVEMRMMAAEVVQPP